MLTNDLSFLKEKIQKGVLHRDIDESYINGVWDYATNYVKNHFTFIHSTEMEKQMQVSILYDFIYELLENKEIE